MEDAARYAIGIDLGGTKIAGGLVDLETGAILVRHSTPTAAERGGQAVLQAVAEIAAALADTARTNDTVVAGLGLGICELVDANGTITSAHTIDWRGISVARELAAIAPVVIEADVRAHALAEATYGAGGDLCAFVFVTVGTGISSCLVLDGRPHAGAHGNALVLASSPLTTTCMTCGAVTHPVLEAYASGPALVTRYNQTAGATLVRAEDVFTVASAGDHTAGAIIQSAGEALGVSLGWLVNVLDPQALVIGGGLGMAEGRYWEAMHIAARAHIWAETSRSVPILRATLGADAGIIGAARRTIMVC